MIRLATVFSGIGSIEQALLRLGVDHEIVFACDNGDVELNLFDKSTKKEYTDLKTKRGKRTLRILQGFDAYQDQKARIGRFWC